METLLNGRYQRQEQLGEGGMGVVYRATDKLTAQEIALKQIILPTKPHPSPIREQATNLKLALAREFQILATLRHPYIITVLDYGFDEAGNPFFTMPYLAQSTTILKASEFLDQIGKLKLLHQLIQALIYLHRQGIVHCDLKPSNILVNNHQVKVVDFGLSLFVNETPIPFSGGTPHYIAPEVWQGQPYSPASDMFAVGCLAFQLLAPEQDHPFLSSDTFLLDELLEAEPNWHLLSVTRKIRLFLEKLLWQTPEHRLKADDALTTLRLLLGDCPKELPAIRESYLQAATFVGRQTEMQQLKQHLKQAQAAQGTGILISGESGVGKSRLLNEFRIEALVAGFLVLRGQAIAEAGLPYQMWRDPLQQLCFSSELDALTAGTLLPLIPELPDLLGKAITPLPELNGRLSQERLFTAITNLFRQQTRPILLLLEDLQWADDSLEIVQWLMRAVQTMPLLIVATYRSDERPSLPKQLPSMNYIPLERLADEDIRTLCHKILGPVGSTPTLVTFLQQQSEGNTFFLIEIVRTLAQQAGQLQAISNLTLPDTILPAGIQSILERQLARVPPSARPLLHLAALVGRYIDIPLMTYLAGEEMVVEHEWLPLLAETTILTIQEGRWLFGHDKLRQGLITQLAEQTVPTLHQQIACATERLYPEDASRAAALMHHWHQAGQSDKEKTYALQAGQYAQKQMAYQEAITYFRRAEQLMPATDYQQRYQLFLEQEELYHIVSQREKQGETLDKLSTLVNHLSTAERATMALRQARYACYMSDYAQTITYAQSVIEWGQRSRRLDLVANGYEKWADALWRQGHFTEAKQRFQTSLQLAQEIGDTKLVATSLNGLGVLAGSQRDYMVAQAYFEQSLRIRQEIGDLYGLSYSLGNLGIIFMLHHEDYPTAKTYYEQALSWQQKIGDRSGASLNFSNLGTIVAKQGNYKQAQTYYEQALTIRQEIGDRSGAAACLNNLGGMAINLADYTLANTYLSQALLIWQEIEHLYGKGMALNNLGRVAFVYGDMSLAETYYQQALILRQELNLPHYRVEDWAGLAQVKLAQGETEMAQWYGRQVLDYLQENPTLKGASKPMRTFCLTWEVLHKLGLRAAADRIVTYAVEVMQNYLNKNSDPTLQDMYLGQPYHRVLWRAWKGNE